MSQQNTAVFPVRLTRAEKQMLRELAAKDGLSMSNWVRKAVRKSFKRRIADKEGR